MAEAQKTTMVKVRGFGGDANTHIVLGKPGELSVRVNEAMRADDRFVTFEVPTEKTLAVIAKRVEAIWQE
jgi:hypothetical protein